MLSVLLQPYAMGCAGTCLAIYLSQFDDAVSAHAWCIATFQSDPHAKYKGVTIHELIGTASLVRLNLIPYRVRSPKAVGAELPLPAIMYVPRIRHYVVLEFVRGNHFHIIDPLVGRRRIRGDDPRIANSIYLHGNLEGNVGLIRRIQEEVCSSSKPPSVWRSQLARRIQSFVMALSWWVGVVVLKVGIRACPEKQALARKRG